MSATRDDAAVLQAMAEAANAAPSGGNVQLWRLRTTADALELHQDRSYKVGLDVAWRGSAVALGAAVWNARVAAAAHGRAVTVERFPDPDRPLLAATVTLGGEHHDERAELAQAIWDRTTNRNPGDPSVPVPDADVEAWRRAAEAEGGRARIVRSPGVLAACAEVLGASDRLRLRSPWLARELFSELRFPGRDRLDVGLDARTLEVGRVDLAMMRLLRASGAARAVLRRPVSAMMGKRGRDTVRASSALVAVTMTGTRLVDALRGGEAVQRVWVEADRAGWAVHPVTPVSIYVTDPRELRELVPDRDVGAALRVHERLRGLLDLDDDEHLALVMRVSKAPPPTVRSGRRPLAEALAPSLAPSSD